MAKEGTKTKDVSFRKAYKSDYLSSFDVEEMIESNISTIVTIKDICYEENIIVKGKVGNHNVAYFAENIKPMIINAKNCNILHSLYKGGIKLSTWSFPFKVELYVEYGVKMNKEIVSGIRIRDKKIEFKSIETVINEFSLVDSRAEFVNVMKNNREYLSNEEIKNICLNLSKKYPKNENL